MIRPVWQALILLAGFSFCAEFVGAQDEPAGEKHIREIRIQRSTVYSQEQADTSSWARFTNRYHIKTRESVIRSKLLFKEGDVLDADLLEASERALRRFNFLIEAHVSTVAVGADSVDVEVHTRDGWSLVPGVTIDGGGGLATGSVYLMELNLLGYGKKLFAEAIYANDVGTDWLFGYSDYQLFSSRWVGSARYRTGPLIESFLFQARMPLYSPDSKWSYGGSASTADKIIRRFEEGEESDRFAKDQIQVQGYLKTSFGERYHKTHVKLATSYLEADFSTLGTATTDTIPPDQANVTPSISADTEGIGWEEFSYINKMGITEDNWLGHRFGGKLGYGIPVGDGFELWSTRAFLMKNVGFKQRHLFRFKGNVNSEIVRNTVVSAALRYYLKASHHTVATHVSTRLGYELDPSRQYTLGADSGLRGYPARQFTGEKVVLMNLEDRQFWGEISVGPQIAIGTVVFVDAGNVWKAEQDIDLGDLNWSAGFGFRFGASKLPHQPVFRIDFGWAIDQDSFAITIGQEQQF